MSQPRLITIEGTEGAGKSTALSFIRDYFAAVNRQAVFTREPGGTQLGEAIRELLLHANHHENIQPETELLLMFAARAQHIQQVIQPALAAGQWVVSDRYVDASYAYQGGGRGIPLADIAVLDKQIVKNCYPVLTLLLDVAPEVGFERTTLRQGGKDRIERESIDFFKRVRQVYLDRAKQDPVRMKVIDASRDLTAVQQQMTAHLNQVVKGGHQ